MQLQLIDKKQVSLDIISFYFKPETPVDWKPGQYLRYHIETPNPDDRGMNRFFSIASAPFEKHIQLTTKFMQAGGSSFKKDLLMLIEGGSVEAFGPKGDFSTDDPDGNYVFIAGGMGITPFRAILLDLAHSGKPFNVTLIYANRTLEFLFKDELEDLAKKHPEFQIFYIVSDEEIAKKKIAKNITLIPGKIGKTLISELIPELLKPVYYISGPEAMVMDLESKLWDMGVKKENTVGDYFPGYESF